MSDTDWRYVAYCYRLCFEGAEGAIQHLLKKDISNPETVRYYANLALFYLSYRGKERALVNKIKDGEDVEV